MKTKKLGPAARFGPRYGFTIRRKVRDIEIIQRAKHVCPYCGKRAVKRESNAVWKCKRCGARFTGGAYYPQTEIGKKILKTIGKLEW
jgi:large subunit ribosomal protein L37Ae